MSIRSFTASELQIFLKGINVGGICEMKSISCWLILLIITVFKIKSVFCCSLDSLKGERIHYKSPTMKLFP